MTGSPHSYKYRLACVVAGEWVMGYDNEAGKGDHRHLGVGKMGCKFKSPRQLMADFSMTSRSTSMSTLTIDVRSLSDSQGDAVQAVEAGRAQGPRYSFSSAQALMRTLGGKRFDLIQALAGAGAVTIREVARRAERDVKAVHVDFLLKAA